MGSIVGVTLSPMKRQIRELSHQIDTKLSQDYSFSSNTSMSHQNGSLFDVSDFGDENEDSNLIQNPEELKNLMKKKNHEKFDIQMELLKDLKLQEKLNFL